MHSSKEERIFLLTWLIDSQLPRNVSFCYFGQPMIGQFKLNKEAFSEDENQPRDIHPRLLYVYLVIL